jgi:hypothetical protein
MSTNHARENRQRFDDSEPFDRSEIEGTIVERFLRVVERNEGAPAYTAADSEFTYADLRSKSAAIAAAIHRLIIRRDGHNPLMTIRCFEDRDDLPVRITLGAGP